MEMTPRRWQDTCQYLSDVFGRVDGPSGDAQLATLMPRAVAAGLPDIAVSHDVGRLLKLLTQTATHDAASTGVVIELGTLAGYSGIWLARGLPASGRLITVEYEPEHARFASAEFERAGVGDCVEVIIGAALDVLPRLAERLGPRSIDMAFLDAIKTEYERYAAILTPMLRPGGLLVADNALGSGSWWIDSPPGTSPERDAVDRFNRTVAGNPGFQTACVPIRQGVLIARKTD